MPKLDSILETAIHTEDMARARAFYEGVFGLEPIYSDNRLTAYPVAGRDVLLVFRKGTTGQTVTLPSGTIPGHGGDGALHVAFAIGKNELDRWEAHLASHGVVIEGRNDWERGGRSIYFRDPDGHLLELATPGLWSVYLGLQIVGLRHKTRSKVLIIEAEDALIAALRAKHENPDAVITYVRKSNRRGDYRHPHEELSERKK